MDRKPHTAAANAPLACQLDALTSAQRQRHSLVTQTLAGLVQSIDSLPDGYALRLPAGHHTLALAAEFVASERLCCPFLSLSLEADAHASQFRLCITGGPAVKDFVRDAMLPTLAGRDASDKSGESHV